MASLLVMANLSLPVSIPAESQAKQKPNNSFPWDLVTENGKLLGCIYQHQFYSLGAWLIENDIPKKCEIGPAQNGVWLDLNDAELEVYFSLKQLKQREEQELETTEESSSRLSPHEVRLIRLVRQMNKMNKSN